MRIADCGLRNEAVGRRSAPLRLPARPCEYSAFRIPNSAIGMTLVEVLLVVGLIAVLSAMILPDLVTDIERRRLPESADRMRSLVILTRAHAMFDGKRYRIRFPTEEELDDEGDDRQPLVEREDDPLKEPGIFNPVEEPWVYGETLLRDVWCIQARLEKPTIERLREGGQNDDVSDRLAARFEDEDPDFPSLVIEPDGTSEWATFAITSISRELTVEDLEEGDPVIEVILDGDTGLIWLQRPFFEEELDMLEEFGWPPVLRQDFLRPELLTEADVLEIKERLIRQ